MASNKQLKAKCESQGVLLVPYKENCISCSVWENTTGDQTESQIEWQSPKRLKCWAVAGLFQDSFWLGRSGILRYATVTCGRCSWRFGLSRIWTPRAWRVGQPISRKCPEFLQAGRCCRHLVLASVNHLSFPKLLQNGGEAGDLISPAQLLQGGRPGRVDALSSRQQPPPLLMLGQ